MARAWQPRAMGVVAAAVLAGLAYSPNAQALALGRITVHSALGEPLRAEIEIPQISAEESASLQAGVASPEAFRAAGLEYNPSLSGVQVSLQRHPDGRHYLRLSSSRPILEPFLDLVLSTQWSSGRLVRDYTLLLDPPQLRQGAAQPVTPAQLPSTPAASLPGPDASPALAARPATARGTSGAARAVPPPTQPARPAAAAGDTATLKVQTGDTAGRLAAQNKPPNISLDQMLVAMLRANPQAFIGGNVNRIRAGAVLTLPTEEQAAAVPPDEARRTIVAQSSDFNALRRKLAEHAPSLQASGPGRQTSGSLSARLEDKQASTAAADRLTISKGQLQGKAPEAAVAQAREAQAASERLAELSRNVNELARLEAASSAQAGASAPVGPAGGLTTPPAAPVVAAGASAPIAAAAQAAPPASATAARAASEPRSATAPPAPPSPSFIDMLLENPLMPAAAAALVALLAGLGLYRARQRRKSAPVDSSFFESRQPADSFFGASGGQQVDTKESSAQGSSSMMYSPSQLDAAGDVDPVAEADVYLAYGRDLQAEEILREALRIDPTRVSLHAKLLEIHAKRRDPKAFEALALETHGLTSGSGPEWQRICELGRGLDPQNPLYQPGGQPPAKPRVALQPDRANALLTPDTMPQPAAAPVAAAAASLPVDLDLNLDFPSTEAPDEPPAPARQAIQPRVSPPPAPPERPAAPQVPPAAAEQPAATEMGLDFGSLSLDEPDKLAPAAAPDLLPELDLDFAPAPQAPLRPSAAPAAAPLVAAPTAPAIADDANMIEFDLGALSLDLGAPSSVPDAATEATEDDPLATKLALAQEFHAIGDTDGARALVEEVVAEASGPLKSRAERFLAELA